MDDIAIIGAGPAGAWAAWRLAAAGARVVVFDASHPREKPCGGGVTGRALALVEAALGGAALPRVDVTSLLFEADGEREAARVPLDRQALVVFNRTAFDRALLDAAVDRGATLVPERVTRIASDATGVRIETSAHAHRAAFIVGADGATSLVRRQLGAPFTRRQLSIGTGFFAHGISSTEIVIRAIADPPGYIWSFPRTDHLAIGICAQADVTSVETLKGQVHLWIAASGIARGARLETYAWPIPSLAAADFRRDAIAGERWLLTGDAAGLVDPITREGIFFAIQSAGFAADAFIQGRGPREYAAQVARTIHPELERAASLKAGFFRPRFTALLVRALRESARVREVMADLVAGRQPYHGLSARLLRTFELGLALRLLGMRLSGGLSRNTRLAHARAGQDATR